MSLSVITYFYEKHLKKKLKGNQFLILEKIISTRRYD